MEFNETITPVLAGIYSAIQVQKMLATQAEISFKAGIREVVEWIEGHRSFSTLMSHMGREEWETQGEDWGIK